MRSIDFSSLEKDIISTNAAGLRDVVGNIKDIWRDVREIVIVCFVEIL